MTRLEAFLAALAVMVLPSPRGHHHRPVPAKSIQDDAQTVTFPRINAHPYPKGDPR